MNLRFSDTLRLATRNITAYKLRSFTIIITISIIFGLLMGVNFLFAGMRRSMLEASVIPTGGESSIVIKYSGLSSSLRDTLDREIDKSHGKRIGTITNYEIGMRQFTVASLEIFQNYTNPDQLTATPADRVPALLDAETYESLAGTLNKQIIDDEYYIVGDMPQTLGDMPQLPGKFNPLNFPLLGSGTSSWRPMFAVVLDDGSGKVDDYIGTLRQQAILDDDYNDSETVYQVVKFDDLKDLSRFVAVAESSNSSSEPVAISSLFSNTAGIVQEFLWTDHMISIFEIILLVVAIIITTLTFVHLIDQDVATIALYRSLGASTGQILFIYLVYLIELCLIAVVVSIFIGLIVVLIMSLMNGATLAELLQSTYHLPSLPHVSLFSIDYKFFIIIGLTLLTAPAALLLSSDRFSSRHLAKVLKED